jgi:hypothetical protein
VAPVATIQQPTILSAYTVRPPWNVAGVDYAVGIPSGTVLRDWRTINNGGPSIPCLSVNLSAGLINITCDVTINAIDFSDSFAPGTSPGSAVLSNTSGGASNITITNSNFKNSAHNANYQNSFELNESNQANVTFTNNKFDGINTDGVQGGGFGAFTATSGNATYNYNWFTHATQQAINTNPQSLSGTTTTIKYNLFSEESQYPGAHCNWVQRALQNGNSSYTQDIEFNTTYQNIMSHGEGFQFYDCCGNDSVTLTNPTLSFNTIIALPNTVGLPASGSDPAYPLGANTKATLVHGVVASGATTVVNGKNNQNYIDSTGAGGAVYYTGTMTPARGFSSTGNIDMTTGGTITPP